jgi:hypothetical protein
MLDIYYVDNSIQDTPADPDGLVHACSLSLSEHKSLFNSFKKCEINGVNMRYFEDTLLSPQKIIKMKSIFDADKSSYSNKEAIQSHKKINDILIHAVNTCNGLVAFCD